jgi:hypothetical protein
MVWRGRRKIGQEEIINLLEAHPGVFYTMRELSVILNLNHSGICRAARSVTKRDNFVTKFYTGDVQIVKRIAYVKNIGKQNE